MEQFTFHPVGDRAISVKAGNEIAPHINKKLRSLCHKITEEGLAGVIEYAPTYCSVVIYYDPLVHGYDDMCQILRDMEKYLNTDSGDGDVRIVELPTVYGGEFGQDMETVCNHTGLSEEEVVKRHSGRDYLVYMLGFLPGFTYLGGMDEQLTTPRLSTPRTKIIKGSVGIAGAQTGTYPSDSPGGWQIIGRTPVTLYNVASEKAALLEAGDYVRYVPISKEEFEKIEALGDAYEVKIHHCKESEIRGYDSK